MPTPDNLPAEHRAYARMNASRWIVDCPTRYCRGAMAVTPGDHMVWCRDCGAMTMEIVWPPDVEAIEVILSGRPDWVTRNWDSSNTLEDLAAQNVAHGDPVPGLLEAAGTGRPLMATRDGRVVGGTLFDVLAALPSGARRRAIGV